jgi:GTP-binding protein
MLTVAIIGRPNAGKSTLFNRLTGTIFALVDDMPGVTRDRREGKANIGTFRFNIYDTPGLEEAAEGSLSARMSEQAKAALAEADLALLLLDGKAGVTAADAHFARMIRKTGKPVVAVVNKCETRASAPVIQEAYGLGFGEPVAISAAHGEGMADLCEALMRFEKEETQPPVSEAESTPDILHIAIVGRPNAGKSTLFNKLLGFERNLTGPEAGITRDAIAVDLDYQGRHLRLVDTAGLRKSGNVSAKIEKMAAQDAKRAIQYANLVILLLDAEYALEKQDLTLADHVEKEGRGVIIAINKWDKVEDKQRYLADAHARIEQVLPQIEGVFVQPICAESGQHLDKLMEGAFKTYETWNRHIPTSKLNDWLQEAISRHPPPLVEKRRIKLRYVTQFKTRPPTFALFASKADQLPETYGRYLVHSLRRVFELPGVPIRLLLRRNKNPYHDKS